ncbi:YdeI/OmpD-associated family protein [Subtercola sp. PAMC28395]|uniref:YdeI/OmpD-associated family protein n=1 Tax=Subtercola sp. PAMC28395 TaxID=2846775 RepID=UPI001C0D41A8|nr:YdeI/OmpD-associated family protein [Subtercola sp. PAMC28395]QWT24754.1 YdeI/OmpD-associated family protein [Subtercola sp. PAMC28395]
MKFRTTLQASGKTATGIHVPTEVYESLGSAKRHAVTVTINGYSYRSTVTPYRGEIMLPVSAEVRSGAGIAAGDEIEVEIVLDEQPREVIVPEDFAAALDAAPAARTFFDSLSYSNKRRFTVTIDDAKTPETRQRRIEKSVATLATGTL